jgi:hypothetical protein
MATVSLRCGCGQVEGQALEVEPSSGTHVVCLCDDCQAYAHYLGDAEKTLDANGGTEIFQLTPSQLKITKGLDRLKCVRLTERGMVRWYAGCCKTPFANTLASPKVPFAGVVHRFLAVEGKAKQEALGPVLAKVQGRFGIGPLPPDVHRRGPIGLVIRTVKLLAVSWRKGRHAPSPFFDDKGRRITEPVILSPAEREALRKSCGPK